MVVARGKDELFDLLEKEDWDTVKWPARSAKGGKLSLAMNILKREAKLLALVRKFRPHLMAGTDLGITHVGKLLGIPSIVINEDDSKAIPLMESRWWNAKKWTAIAQTLSHFLALPLKEDLGYSPAGLQMLFDSLNEIR